MAEPRPIPEAPRAMAQDRAEGVDFPDYEAGEERRFILPDGPEDESTLQELEAMGYAKENALQPEWRVTRKGELRLLDPDSLTVEEVHEL